MAMLTPTVSRPGPQPSSKPARKPNPTDPAAAPADPTPEKKRYRTRKLPSAEEVAVAVKGRRLLSSREVAALAGKSLVTLERWRRASVPNPVPTPDDPN